MLDTGRALQLEWFRGDWINSETQQQRAALDLTFEKTQPSTNVNFIRYSFARCGWNSINGNFFALAFLSIKFETVLTFRANFKCKLLQCLQLKLNILVEKQ